MGLLFCALARCSGVEHVVVYYQFVIRNINRFGNHGSFETPMGHISSRTAYSACNAVFYLSPSIFLKGLLYVVPDTLYRTGYHSNFTFRLVAFGYEHRRQCVKGAFLQQN